MTPKRRHPRYHEDQPPMQTVVHVTHEAIQKIGGIGAVLQGLLTSPVYLAEAKRNILVGPFWPGEERGEHRLGPQGEVLYSSMDALYRSPLAERFREIEQTYDVGIIYGRRRFVDKESGVVKIGRAACRERVEDPVDRRVREHKEGEGREGER